MLKCSLLSFICLILAILPARATPQDDQFQKIAHEYIEGLLATHPEFATELGDHRFAQGKNNVTQELPVN